MGRAPRSYVSFQFQSICCFGGQLCAPPPCALFAPSHGRTKDAFFALHGAPCSCSRPVSCIRVAGEKVSARECCLPPFCRQLASRARFATGAYRTIHPFFFPLPSFGLRNFFFIIENCEFNYSFISHFSISIYLRVIIVESHSWILVWIDI